MRPLVALERCDLRPKTTFEMFHFENLTNVIYKFQARLSIYIFGAFEGEFFNTIWLFRFVTLPMPKSGLLTEPRYNQCLETCIKRAMSVHYSNHTYIIVKSTVTFLLLRCHLDSSMPRKNGWQRWWCLAGK